MIALRSLIFNILFYLNLAALMIFGSPMLLGGRHGVFVMARLWGSTSLWLLDNICNLRVEYRGLYNIPTSGYIIAAKHQSFLETFAMLKHTPDFAYILKQQLVFIPLFGLYLKVAQQIAINRQRGRNALSQIIAQATPFLREGRQIYIFPEGTRRPPGAPPDYKFGVASLYAGTRAPCLPVALNTGLFWGRRGFSRRPGVAVIEYLPPIEPGMDRVAFSQLLQSKIETACDRLNQEAIENDSALAAALAEGKMTKSSSRDGSSS